MKQYIDCIWTFYTTLQQIIDAVLFYFDTICFNLLPTSTEFNCFHTLKKASSVTDSYENIKYDFML